MRDIGAASIEGADRRAAGLLVLLVLAATVAASIAYEAWLGRADWISVSQVLAAVVLMAAMCAPVGGRPVAAKGIVKAGSKRPQSEPPERGPLGSDDFANRAVLQSALLDQIALVHQVSVDGRITYANASMCQATGYEASCLIGARHSLFNPDIRDGECWRRMHREIVAGELWSGETLNRTRAGADLWLSSTITAVRSESGAVVGYLCASIDITEQTQLKAEFERSGKLIQLGQLTAIVAHEIRNPLGAIRTANYVLERKIRGRVEGVEPQIERINNGIGRCDKIITELLDFSRKRMIKACSLSLDEWVSSVVEDEAKSLLGSPVVTCELNAGGEHASFDPDQLRQVLINLLSNAAEAMGEKINSGLNPGFQPHIRVRTEVDEAVARIVVQDNGPGIHPTNINRIREPLFTTKSFGVGLGLPAIEKILEGHGGGLSIASEFGAGATVTATFARNMPTASTA